jgi:group I intron endonuclease
MENISGIYSITNTVNGKRYVGSTLNYHRRIADHFRDLRNGTHRNCHLQAAFRKYGESAFVAALVECVPIELLLDTEQKHLDENKGGYNIAKCAESPARGAKRSQETRDKMSKAKKGQVRTPEWRANLSKSLKGRTFSPEWRANLSAGCKGKVNSQETRLKMGNAKKGHIKSPETRARLSASKMGHSVSLETKAKIRSARLMYLERMDSL